MFKKNKQDTQSNKSNINNSSRTKQQSTTNQIAIKISVRHRQTTITATTNNLIQISCFLEEKKSRLVKL